MARRVKELRGGGSKPTSRRSSAASASAPLGAVIGTTSASIPARGDEAPPEAIALNSHALGRC